MTGVNGRETAQLNKKDQIHTGTILQQAFKLSSKPGSLTYYACLLYISVSYTRFADSFVHILLHHAIGLLYSSTVAAHATHLTLTLDTRGNARGHSSYNKEIKYTKNIE
jgi:hypothetical protein